MTDFVIKKLPYDLSSHAGLAFIGKYLKRVNVNALIDPKFPVRSGVANDVPPFSVALGFGVRG
jgi:hypothetical protein